MVNSVFYRLYVNYIKNVYLEASYIIWQAYLKSWKNTFHTIQDVMYQLRILEHYIL